MKPFRPLLLSLFSLVSYASPGLDEDAGYVPRNIQIEVQIVVLPEELALPLIPELLDEKTIEAANAKVQALLAAKKAKLIGWPTLTTRNGQRAVTEAVDEIRFVAEYAPQNEVIGPTLADKADDKTEPKTDRAEFFPTPQNFETRQMGVTLEVEPVLSPDGSKIDLNFAANDSKLLGYKKTTVEKPKSGETLVVEQPEFRSTKVTTSLTLRSDQRKLVGVYKVTDPPGHMELFILKASVTELK